MMDRMLLAVNLCGIIVSVIVLAVAVESYGKNRKTRELHAAVASIMALCGSFIRGKDFFLRKNGGDDHFEENQPVKYVNHIDRLKVWIEE